MPRSALPVLLALVGVLFAGCASPLDDVDAGVPRRDVTSAVASDPAAVALLPPAVRQAGVLTVGASVGGPPAAFMLADGVTVVGEDIDMTEAVARVLGLRVQRTEGTFDGIVPGLTSGKFDVATGNFAVTEARKKAVSFVTYINDGQAFAVRADDPQPPIHDLSDLCGRAVSVPAGSTSRLVAKPSRTAPRWAGRPSTSAATRTPRRRAWPWPSGAPTSPWHDQRARYPSRSSRGCGRQRVPASRRRVRAGQELAARAGGARGRRAAHGRRHLRPHPREVGLPQLGVAQLPGRPARAGLTPGLRRAACQPPTPSTAVHRPRRPNRVQLHGQRDGPAAARCRPARAARRPRRPAGTFIGTQESNEVPIRARESP